MPWAICLDTFCRQLRAADDFFLQFRRQRFYDSSLEEPPLDLARALGDILAMELKLAT